MTDNSGSNDVLVITIVTAAFAVFLLGVAHPAATVSASDTTTTIDVPNSSVVDNVEAQDRAGNSHLLRVSYHSNVTVTDRALTVTVNNSSSTVRPVEVSHDTATFLFERPPGTTLQDAMANGTLTIATQVETTNGTEWTRVHLTFDPYFIELQLTPDSTTDTRALPG